MVYFITFSCYGCHLHGSENGSVDRYNNRHGTSYLKPSAKRAAAQSLVEEPFVLKHAQDRDAVLNAIVEVCEFRGWSLLAAHVRTTHVHMVISAADGTKPERILSDCKAYSSRALNKIHTRKRYWTQYGSTRWLWKQEDVLSVTRYVLDSQGETMSATGR